MSEDISTLIMRVISDGIKDGTSQLNDLTKAAALAEGAANKLASTTISAGAATKGATAAQTSATAAVQASTEVLRQQAIQQARDIELHNLAGKAYAAEAAEAYKMNAAIDAAAKGHTSLAGVTREVMVSVHEIAIGSFKRLGGTLMVLANQFGLLGAAVATFGVVTIGAFVAIAAAIGLFAFAAYKGYSELKTFNDHLALTGNYAGVTASGIAEMAKTISLRTGESTVDVRKMGMAMAETGVFTESSIKVGMGALTTYARLSGKTEEEVVAHFAGMKDGVAKWMMEEEKTVPAFTATTLAKVMDLEKLGEHAKAVELAMTEMGDFVEKNKPKLNAFGEAVKFVADMFKDLWQGMKDLTNDDSLEKQLDRAKKLADGYYTFGIKFSDVSTKLASAAKDSISNMQDQIDGQGVLNALIADETAHKKEALDIAGKVRTAEDKRNLDLETRVDLMKRINTELDKEDTGALTAFQKQEYLREQLKRYDAAHKVAKEKGMDDSKALRDIELERNKQYFAEIARQEDMDIAHSLSVANKQHGDQEYELTQREALYDKRIEDLKTMHDKEKAITDAYANEKHTPVELAQNALKAERELSIFQAANDAVEARRQADEDSVAAKETQRHDQAMKHIESTTGAEQKKLEEELKNDKLKEQSIGQLKSVQLAARQEMEITQNKDLAFRIEIAKFAQEEAILNGKLSQNEISETNTQIAAMQKLLGVREEIITSLGKQVGLEQGVEASARMTKDIDDALANAKRFEKGMTAAFGSVGKAIGAMSVAFQQLAKDQDIAHQQFLKASKEDIASGKAKADLQAATADAQITGYANIAQAAQGMFDSNSKGYAAMGAISKVFHIAEAIMNAERMIQLGITAVLNQGQGDPYSAFARMAAMAAIVAGLGVAIGGAGGGGNAPDSHAAAQVQAAQGTGTVFGDTTAKSNSIADSLKLLQANSNLMLPLTQSMTGSLKNIETSMTGLTNLIIRTAGIASGTNMGIETGKKSNLTGALGKLLNLTPLQDPLMRMLFGSSTTSITDSGIQFGGSLANLQQGKGYQQYANVNTQSSSLFGLVHSSSDSTQTAALSAEVSNQFGLIFKNLQTTLVSVAAGLGKNATDVSNTLNNLVISTQTASLNGLKGPELQTAINNVISATMDTIAQAAFPSMGAFQQVGEGYAQTVLRVASDTEIATTALKTLGITAINFNDIVNKSGDVALQIEQQSIALKEGTTGVNEIVQAFTGTAADLITQYQQLVAARQAMQNMGLGGGLNAATVQGAGGLANLTTALTDYQSKYFTTAEQLQSETNDVSKQFADLGKQLPTSRDQLRSWIEAAEKIGDQKMVGQLLALTGNFDKLFTAMGSVNGLTSEVAIAFQKLKDVVAAQKSTIEANFSTASTALSTQHAIAMGSIAQSATAEMTALDQTREARTAAMMEYMAQEQQKLAIVTANVAAETLAVSGLQSILGSLNTAITATTTLTQSQLRENAQSTLQTATTSADIANVPGLADAIKEIQKPSENLYKTFAEYQHSQAEASSALQTIKDKGAVQLTALQQQLAADTATKDAITAESAALQTSLLNVSASDKAAVAAQTAIQQAAENDRFNTAQSALQTQHDAQIAVLDQQLNIAQMEVNAIGQVNSSVVSLGAAMLTFRSAVGNTPSAPDMMNLNIPHYDVGTPFVTADTVAMVHKGERIIPASDNIEITRRLKSSGEAANDPELMAKVQELIEVMQIGDAANVRKSNDMYRIVRQWENNGMPPTRAVL